MNSRFDHNITCDPLIILRDFKRLENKTIATDSNTINTENCSLIINYLLLYSTFLL